MIYHYGYPSITEYRTLIRNIIDRVQYVGRKPDQPSKGVYDRNIPLPKIELSGTVKLHGSNGGIVLTTDDEYYSVSREDILAPTRDNMGFFMYSQQVKNHVQPLLKKVLDEHSDAIAVCLYGEWCGGDIQRKVALVNLPKMFVVFGIKIITPPVHKGNHHESIWLDTSLLNQFENSGLNLYDIHSFETYKITIDLNNPREAQNQLIEFTSKVEAECPVAKELISRGLSREVNENKTGEGIVWTSYMDGEVFNMKVKGEKHSNTKVKVLVPVDPIKLANTAAFIEYACTENRLEQGIDVLRRNNITIDKSAISGYIKWVKDDIVKEELDTLIESNLTVKDVVSGISTKARAYILAYIATSL